MRSFKSNENIHKKEGGSYYVVSANKASSLTLQSPGNESQRKHTAILRTEFSMDKIFVIGTCRFLSSVDGSKLILDALPL